MIYLDRSNLRGALIGIAAGTALAWALSGCMTAQAPPPTPTAAQLAPAPQPKPAPRITGAMILAQQPPEVQQAIQQHAQDQRWPMYRWPRERLVPYTEHATPLTIDVAPFEDVDLALQRGETIDGVSLGDSEEFLVAPIASALPHLILKCKVTGKATTGAVYVSSGRIYRLHLRCRDQTSLDAVSYYYPTEILAEMRVADAAPATPPPANDAIAPMVDQSRINHAYKITGADNIPWKPVKAWDDGTRVYIEMPPSTSPIRPVFLSDNGSAINYQVRGQYYVADSLFNQGEMVSGNDKVTVSRIAQ